MPIMQSKHMLFVFFALFFFTQLASVAEAG